MSLGNFILQALSVDTERSLTALEPAFISQAMEDVAKIQMRVVYRRFQPDPEKGDVEGAEEVLAVHGT